jgi:Gram-negative porin
VNAFYTHTTGGGGEARNTVQTGLLPSALGIGAKTRQNDLDIAFQFTFFVGADSGAWGSSAVGGFNGGGTQNGLQGAAGANTLNIRQAFMSFGDASWGTVKIGRDLGIYGSDAILSDMTLLGVGVGAGGNGSSTLGRIGSGYMYADWIGQIQYQTPNFNGFQATGALTQPWTNGADASNTNIGWQGKVTYDFSANDINGRVWLSGIWQQHDKAGTTPQYDSKGWDIGGKLGYQGAEVVGYYYNGGGLSGPAGKLDGLLYLAGTDSDDSGGYVQATFKVPGAGTKLGASWGESFSKQGAANNKNESWVVGAYHPLTKSLNLVAEYTRQELSGSTVATYNTVSLGAIMFF